MLLKPTIGTHARTVSTAAVIGRIDAAGSGVLCVAERIVRAAVTLAVFIVLRWEATRRAFADPLPVGYIKLEGRHVFRCAWCGSLTEEGGEYPLTCCGMAAREFRRTQWGWES